MKIIGEKNPSIGVVEMYSLVDSENILLTKNQQTNNITYKWYIFKKEKVGRWIDVTKHKKPKIGMSVPFAFGYELEYKLVVYKSEKDVLTQKEKETLLTSFDLKPTRKGKVGKLTKVILYNKGAKNIDLAGFGNTLTARAESLGLNSKEINFYVWNSEKKEKPNVSNSKSIDVDSYGVATVRFNVTELLSVEEKQDLMMGNKKAIGFFVTATYKNQKTQEEQSITNKTPVVIVFGYQAIGDVFADGVSMAKVEKPIPPKLTSSGECFCNRDFEESDVKNFVKLLKGRENIWEGYKSAPCNMDDKSFVTLTKELNVMFKKYQINHCAQKLHFLAQACHETDVFTISEEAESNHGSSKSNYKGRGILQLTGVKGKNDSLYNSPGPYETYSSYVGIDATKKPEIIANQIKYCVDSGGWMFSIFKKMPNAPSPAVDRWGIETAGKSLNELALAGDKYLELISALLNGRNENTDMPNGWDDRKMYYQTLKTSFFMYERFHETSKPKATPKTTSGVVTYHIYANGTIERHVPKTIDKGYEDKYKYVYHDKDDNKYTICTLTCHITKEKRKGIKYLEKPTHSKVVSDESVSDGQTTRRVKYENGDVAEYGYNKKKNFWNLYTSTGRDIEVVKMSESLNYNYLGIVVKYSFSNTKRRYTSPGAMAAFIGALAENGLTGVKTTGSCFSEGTCFPSVAHVNGKSIDTLYMDRASQTKFIKAMDKFNFKAQITGNDGTHTYEGTANKSDHNDHLHSGFNEDKIKIIYEK